MSYKHNPPTWWRDFEAEADAYVTRTAYRDITHRLLVWRGPTPEPSCTCGHPISLHSAIAYINREPVESPVFTCSSPGCECPALTWSEG
jgi:hypothetical protein